MEVKHWKMKFEVDYIRKNNYICSLKDNHLIILLWEEEIKKQEKVK